MHRPRYDDWSFPKGKLDARRELRGGGAARGRGGDRAARRLGEELPPTSYRDHKGRSKIVRYWLMDRRRASSCRQRRGRRGALADARRGRRAPELRARPRAAAPGRRVNRDRFPGLRRRLGAARRPGRHADGRRRDRGDGRLHALRPQRQPARRLRGAEATDAFVEQTRAEVAALFGGDPRGVVFGPSMTALTMRFADAPGDRAGRRGRLHPPRPRRQRAAVGARRRARGAIVRFAEPEPETLELPAALEAVLTERTRWVSVTAASNALGTIPDLAASPRAAHAAGARVYVDAVHAAPHRRLDATLCDVLACSAYKWFGPHIGILCAARRSWRARARQARAVTRRGPRPLRARHAAVRVARRRRRRGRYVRSLDWDAVHEHERRCSPRASTACGAIDGVTLYGDAARPHVDADVQRRRPHRARGRGPRSPSARSPSGTATTTPTSSSATSASPPTAPSAPASSTTTTNPTPTGW